MSRECRRLELEKGISAYVRRLPELQRKVQKGYNTCTLHLECLDQTGIVYKTSRFLADNKLNILNLNSTAKTSPESGATIYSMDIYIQIPKEISLDQVEEDLSTMADELPLDISMSC